ncbi:hypothetical protein K461DRAFT_296843 [Myriangium duriaei CBS 260.36]|uniref:GST N-terminal domain-containing protein n=1 Tax=Myriangium duriaei CBS 260.36 TaxID=1168546 RepID=A0A9P4MGW3_9PEZI|nr:hypothetical protein K461DRAFT_296843 [Myriangium duriaei CBS 260.36]
MAAAVNGTSSPSITFYTNRGCPWAQRAQITLKELKLPYEEVTIDLNTPREDWYLKINPRGLVPSINFTGGGVHDEILTESAVVSQFLADVNPSHLTQPDHIKGAQAALFRARVAFFVDSFFSKVNTGFYPLLKAESQEEKDKLVHDTVEAIKKEIEPLLKDANPFFGGSSKLTMAEVLTAPFVQRYLSFSQAGLLPESLKQGLESLPNFSKWANEVVKQDSVQFGFDEQKIIEGMRNRIAKLKAQAK